MLARTRIFAAFVETVRGLVPADVRLAVAADLPISEEELPAVVLRAGESEVTRASVGRPAALEHIAELRAEILVKYGRGSELRAEAIAERLLAALEGAQLAGGRALGLRSIGEIEDLAEQEVPGVRLVLAFDVRYRTREGAPGEIL